MNKDIRRLFLKYVVLTAVNEKSTYGYDIIKTIETCSEGKWKPSTGSVYPILDNLESEGFIRSEEKDRKKVYTITPEGMKALDRMTRKKNELLRDMTTLIGNITKTRSQ